MPRSYMHHAYLRRLALLTSTAVALVVTTFADADSSAPKFAANEIYLQPVAGLSADELQQFRGGEKMFRTTWLSFPLIQNNWEYTRPPGMAAWGLGPTFIANSCVACHVQGGHGKTVDKPTTPLFQQLLRVSLPGQNPHGGPRPHPHYGDQLQVFDVIAADPKQGPRRQGEADVYVDWLPERVTLADGTAVELRKPKIVVENLAFGPLDDDVMTSLRNSRAIFGLGYLESVSEEEVLRIAAAQQAAGINGHLNYVRDDVNGKTSLGRFGWKANQPSVRQQIAAAFLGDMGITSPLYTKQNCPEVQAHCKATPPGDRAELFPNEFDDISFWAMALDVPARRNPDDAIVRRGERLFSYAHCAQCHVPQMTTSAKAAFPALAGKTFHAYTDLLLHDMGEGLADGRPDYQAGPRDWRTSPLWGIGLSKQVNGSTNLLHDGRARDVQEAILWHGGDAQPARDAFIRMEREDREALVAFVNSL